MLQFIIHQFCLAKLRKTAQKALSKARKSGAEGESLKLVKEFALFSAFERLFILCIILLFSFKGLDIMLFYANSWFIRFFFVSLQPKAASTGYASAIQVNLIALGLHRPCP